MAKIMTLTGREKEAIAVDIERIIAKRMPKRGFRLRRLGEDFIFLEGGHRSIMRVDDHGLHCYSAGLRSALIREDEAYAAFLDSLYGNTEALITGVQAAAFLGYKNVQTFGVIVSTTPSLKALKISIPSGGARWRQSDLARWAESRTQEK